MPTPINSPSGCQISRGRPRPIGAFVLLGMAAAVFAGCQGSPGSGHRNLQVADLKVGAEAKLVSFDDSDVIVDSFVPATGKAAARSSRARKVEKVRLPVGTTVIVRQIVGDDAHVVIQDGASAGLNCWVECLRLEPQTK